MSADFRVKDILGLCVDWNSIASSVEAVDEFVDAVDGGLPDMFDDRRSTKRKAAMIDVIAVPLDAEHRPCGEAFLALSRDISRGGISILCTEEVKAPFLLLRLEMARFRMLQAVVRIIRSRSFYQFTEVSACFVTTGAAKAPTTAGKKSSAAGRRRSKPAAKRRTKRSAGSRKPARAV